MAGGRRFGGDRSIIGRQITVQNTPVIVVGVLPPGFENVLGPSAEIWSPLRYDKSLPLNGREWGRHLRMVGRMRAGVQLQRVREELSLILDRTTRGEFAQPEQVIDGETLVRQQALVREVIIAPHVQDYAIRLTLATHPQGPFAAAVTAINLVLGSLAGYAYSRYARSRLLAGSLWVLMMTRMLPSLALILPFFIVFKNLGLLDTRTALIIAYCSLILPLCIWIMKGYFDGLPPNLEKAALVDGCTRFQAIRKIVMPVARPGIVAAGIFCFLVSWNEFIFALILTGTPQAQTIPVIIAGFLVQLRFYDYGPMFAASVLAVLPPVIITLAFQRYLVRGMLSGSLKG